MHLLVLFVAWYGSTMPTDCQSWLWIVMWYHELLTALFPGHNFRWGFTEQPISPSILHYGLQTEPERENYWWTGKGSLAIIHLHRQDWSGHQIISWSSKLVPWEWYPIVRCLQWSLYQGTDMQCYVVFTSLVPVSNSLYNLFHVAWLLSMFITGFKLP
jgi:hypothetical protein